MFTIELRNAKGVMLARAEGTGDARLVYKGDYREGDRFVFTADTKHVVVSVDQGIEPAPVYLRDEAFTFIIPFGDAKNGYAPQAFYGMLHTAYIRPAGEDTRLGRRNLALNPLDQHHDAGCYPHASANVETRGEAQFWARNAIDGTRFNDRHGTWPYHSWGIGERKDAALRIDFGREVEIDEAALVLRADFPHDAWWEQAALECSDGASVTLDLVKTREVQRFAFPPRKVEWVCLSNLVKADDPSPFPALSQLEVYGREGA